MAVESATEPVLDKENVAPPRLFDKGGKAGEETSSASSKQEAMATSTADNVITAPAEDGQVSEADKKKRKRRKKKKKKKKQEQEENETTSPETEETPRAGSDHSSDEGGSPAKRMEVEECEPVAAVAEETHETESKQERSPSKQQRQDSGSEPPSDGGADEEQPAEEQQPPQPPGSGGEDEGEDEDEGGEEEDDDDEGEAEAPAAEVLEEEYLTVDEDAPSPLSMAGKEEGEVVEEEEEETVVPETPFEEPSAATSAAIVKQMEFYFSDANILKDYFLLRRIRKNKGGWLRVSLVAGFKLMQKITADWRQVAFAVKHHSSLLELDEEGVRVRRRGGLPEWDHHVYKRTCLVFGFDRLTPRRQGNPPPSTVSVNFVRDELFGKFQQHVKLVRILKPGKEVPLDLRTCVRNHKELGQYLCAVVEFDTVDSAEAARRAVDFREWSRSHLLTVKILGKRTREPLDVDGYMMFQRAPHPYFGKVHPPLHGNSYADKVRGRKRPAPETYAERVKRGAETAAAVEKEAAVAESPRREKRLVPERRHRRQQETKEERQSATEQRRDEGTQTAGSLASDNVGERRAGQRPRLVVTRQPRGPPEEGSGVTWARQRPPRAKEGLQRRRSVRELVKKFEAMSADDQQQPAAVSSPAARRKLASTAE